MKKVTTITRSIFSAAFLIAISAAPSALATGGWNPGNYTGTGLPTGTVASIVYSISMWILGLFGFIGVIGFVIAGILYLTAAGNAEQEKTAKKALYMSIIGVLVGLVGLVVLQWADSLLNARQSF